MDSQNSIRTIRHGWTRWRGILHSVYSKLEERTKIYFSKIYIYIWYVMYTDWLTVSRNVTLTLTLTVCVFVNFSYSYLTYMRDIDERYSFNRFLQFYCFASSALTTFQFLFIFRPILVRLSRSFNSLAYVKIFCLRVCGVCSSEYRAFTRVT
jgi:hypothetical protein